MSKKAAPNKKATPAKNAAPAKKASRQVTGYKATACFNGAGDLNPTKEKVVQPKKR